MRSLHGSPSSRVGDRPAADGDAAVALLWRGREAGGDVGRVERRRRRHAAELGVQPGRAVGAVVAGLARVRAAPRAPPPGGHQPARRQQPAVRGAADVTVLASRGSPPGPRGHLRVIVPPHDVSTAPSARERLSHHSNSMDVRDRVTMFTEPHRDTNFAMQTIRSQFRSRIFVSNVLPGEISSG